MLLNSSVIKFTKYIKKSVTDDYDINLEDILLFNSRWPDIDLAPYEKHPPNIRPDPDGVADIDDLDPAILNSRMNIKVQQRITPSTTVSSSYELAYPMPIAIADDVNYRVVSSQFTFSNSTCIIRNRLNTTTLQIENANTGQVLVDNVASFTPPTGKVNLVGFLPTSVQNDGVLKIGVVPANESTIRPLRNYIIDVDTALLTITPIIDFQNTESVVTT